MFDLSDDDGTKDEAFPPLPPPHSPGQGGQDEGDPFANGEKLYVEFSQNPKVRVTTCIHTDCNGYLLLICVVEGFVLCNC